ncbi:MAG: hypothetical protein Q7J13_02130 [Brevundimonas sp.]|uniref:hypothetical protein n=1 Tax=Brevundimonas sp. TaxID=1871086 RepID=UPI0027163752|nr:hypothetical protein [Brevundimonas sp.]MDO9586708.1 hypothetical protein [Brevundimonas sp.]
MTPQNAARGLLQPGEKIVWTGAPHALLFLSRRQGAAVAFNLVWWLILLLAGASAWAMRDSPLVIVIGGIFLIGVLQDSWRTGRWLVRRVGETYALTDRRVLVIERSGRLRAEAGLLSAHRFRAAPPSGERGAVVLGDDQPLWSPSTGRRLKLNPDEDALRFSGQIGHLALLDLIRRTAADYEVRWAAEANAPEG